jgi:hypothetical protein
MLSVDLFALGRLTTADQHREARLQRLSFTVQKRSTGIGASHVLRHPFRIGAHSKPGHHQRFYGAKRRGLRTFTSE